MAFSPAVDHGTRPAPGPSGDMVALVIDGETVTVPAGTSVMRG